MSAVTLTINGSVALIRLENLKKYNALDRVMLGQLDRHLDALRVLEDVRCVVVTGEGAKAFCVGADISDWSELSPRTFARDWVHDGHRIFDKLARLPQPTIGAVNGYAFGGGLELAAACDVRILGPKAHLALPEAGIGVVPGWSGTQRLVRLMPEPMVREMALLGRRIMPERAVQAGFAACVVEDAMAEAMKFAQDAAKLSPFASDMVKAMINAAVAEDSAASIEAMASAAVVASADLSEGVSAFREKRPAMFKGA